MTTIKQCIFMGFSIYILLFYAFDTFTYFALCKQLNVLARPPNVFWIQTYRSTQMGSILRNCHFFHIHNESISHIFNYR